MRLDKYLADAMGLPRSQVKQAIRKGQVTVGGQAARDCAYAVRPGEDAIDFMGRAVCYERYVYYMLHKPAGCVTARKDPKLPTVFDYVRDIPCKELFAVGRLDRDTEGLLLLTNDGALDHALMSPKKHVRKTYYFEANGILTAEGSRKLEQGLLIAADEPPTAPAVLDELCQRGQKVSGCLTITEGRFHQVKRMLHAVGCEVTYLKRTAIGALRLDEGLQRGEYRPLTEREVQALRG